MTRAIRVPTHTELYTTRPLTPEERRQLERHQELLRADPDYEVPGDYGQGAVRIVNVQLRPIQRIFWTGGCGDGHDVADDGDRLIECPECVAALLANPDHLGEVVDLPPVGEGAAGEEQPPSADRAQRSRPPRRSHHRSLSTSRGAPPPV